MHITLVNPPYPRGTRQHQPFIPLCIGYLAAVLETPQYDVDVIDCQRLKRAYEKFESEIGKRQPTIVGTTSTSLTYKSTLHVAKMAKGVYPKCLTVLRGCHATFWGACAC